VIFDRGANRQSPSRQVRIPVRDAAGALLGFVGYQAAAAAVYRGQAFWRGTGRAKYIMVMATAGRTGWMMPPSTEAEPLPGRLFGQPRQHSRAPSWRITPDLPSSAPSVGSGGGRRYVPQAAAGIFELPGPSQTSHECV